MSLLEEAQALAKRPGGTCGVALLVRRLGETEQAELLEAMDDPITSSRGISLALDRRGYTVSYQTIQRHRRGDCACDQ